MNFDTQFLASGFIVGDFVFKAEIFGCKISFRFKVFDILFSMFFYKVLSIFRIVTGMAHVAHHTLARKVPLVIPESHSTYRAWYKMSTLCVRPAHIRSARKTTPRISGLDIQRTPLPQLFFELGDGGLFIGFFLHKVPDYLIAIQIECTHVSRCFTGIPQG
jgi:hypothetical protein